MGPRLRPRGSSPGPEFPALAEAAVDPLDVDPPLGLAPRIEETVSNGSRWGDWFRNDLWDFEGGDDAPAGAAGAGGVDAPAAPEPQQQPKPAASAAPAAEAGPAPGK